MSVHLFKNDWKDFFRDAKGIFNVFTCIAMLSGFTLVTAPLVTRLFGWIPLTQAELTTLTLVYCISALSDYLLAIYLNKMPSITQVADTISNQVSREEISDRIE